MKLLLLSILITLTATQAYALGGKGIFNCGGYPRTGTYGLTDPSVAGMELLFEWREIEPEEGVYDWKLIDDAMKPWADAGKMVALRVMAACNEKNASPMWVFDKYDVPMVDSSKYADSNIIYPQFWNETFIEKYSAMVRELAKRYDGHPSVEFVQVGGVGRWEETYVHTDNDEMSGRWQELGYNHSDYIRHCKRMADIFRKYFKKTPVLLSISIGGPDPSTPDRKPVGYQLADYAVKRGLYLKQNGWGAHYSYTDHEHFSRIFAETRGKTKRIYEQGVATSERWGWERGTFRSSINRALLDCPDYLWIYQTDLAKPEFQADIKWAAKHLSAQSYRDMGPLYIRFKEFKPHYENPTYDPVYQDESNGLVNVPYPGWPDKGNLEPATIDGVDCKTTTPACPHIYLDLEDTAIIQESGGTNRIARATMDIRFYDEGTSPVAVEYNWNGSEFESKVTVNKTDLKRWRMVRVELSDLRFQIGLGAPEKDFRIGAGDGELALCEIKLFLYGMQ